MKNLFLPLLACVVRGREDCVCVCVVTYYIEIF